MPVKGRRLTLTLKDERGGGGAVHRVTEGKHLDSCRKDPLRILSNIKTGLPEGCTERGATLRRQRTQNSPSPTLYPITPSFFPSLPPVSECFVGNGGQNAIR
jgi:hypothetical protein